ncbi:hypothetical protein FVEN_g8077 [Fusarium venenatum]|uniref:Uncharacterized protein n=1 Tax=Fusarium venenatum TaxID=56646 RepID=A0A2L2TLU5_9HYPO|nr:uncharacterized protein FVRRES_04571 [Fusarium venenatum]KAG8353835.1 hypothetical protein FVEN_g8077 [Fusarium venenatum]CEI60135.1 unnamed protein product [Fusarium venenatum]
MQFNLVSLCIFASALPATIAQRTEENAVTIKTFPNMIGCGWGVSGHTDSFPDGECFHLPRDYMDVKHITETCRVFLYMKNDCTKHEKQVHQGQDCIDIRDYQSFKAFCH